MYAATVSERMSEGDGDREPAGETAADSGGRPCPLCETPMYHRHCKYVCPAHGVVYDCSDTFY
jgi:hypothetical protein